MIRSVFAMTLTIGLIMICTSCMDKSIKNTDNKRLKTTGWIDEDTYIVSVVGEPSMTLQDKEERKESALNAAIMNAKARTRNDFMKIRKFLPPDVNQAIQGGIVKGEPEYDTELKCKIYFKVKSSGLKNKLKD